MEGAPEHADHEETEPVQTHCKKCGNRYTMADLVKGHVCTCTCAACQPRRS